MNQSSKRPILLTTFLIISSIVVSVLLAEVSVRYLCNFPPAGITNLYHIYPNDAYVDKNSYENVYKPYAKYFNNECGYKVYRKNNYGLPGLDIDDAGKQNVVVLGNSYIESRATPPHLLATSIFMKFLQVRYPNKFQVINLALGGQTPYFGLYRLKFWSPKIKPDYVILILEGNMIGNTKSFSEDKFTLPKDFGTPITDLKITALSSICSLSSYVNLLRNGIKYSKNIITQHNENIQKIDEKESAEDKITVYKKMLYAIKEYYGQYGDKFLLFSLLDNEWNEQIKQECVKYNINFYCDSKIRSIANYQLKKGHFNNKGNEALGYKLYLIFNNQLGVKKNRF